VKDHPALFCGCCTTHVHSERLCADCQQRFIEGSKTRRCANVVLCECDEPVEMDPHNRSLTGGELREYLHEGCDRCLEAVLDQWFDPVNHRPSWFPLVLTVWKGLTFAS
jgi:hypothetical protein